MECPYCNNQVMLNAVRCRHCGEWLDDNARQQLAPFVSQQAPIAAMVKCPYCAEQIQADARKCRYCNEWLESATGRAGMSTHEVGSVDARAVAKGIKKQKQDEAGYRGCGCLSLIAGCVVGAIIGGEAGLVVGGMILFGGMGVAWSQYMKE